MLYNLVTWAYIQGKNRYAQKTGKTGAFPRLLMYSKSSGACGRNWASWSQHCCVNAHNPSFKAWLVGRGGRSPPTIANTAAEGDLSLNGTAPVKTFVQMNYSSVDVEPQ